MVKFLVGIAALILTVILGLGLWLFWPALSYKPGGGGATQSAPDTILVGQALAITLEVSVWGAGGSIADRYKDVLLYYRTSQESESQFRRMAGTREQRGDTAELYTFRIPASTFKPGDEVVYYFELKLDGVPNRIQGIRTIKVQRS